MINEFATLFEARERKQQIERIYRGESVDLVGRVLSDGVPISLENYSVSGIYQPTVSAGDTKFYELSAEVVDNEKVVVHWTYDNDWGQDSYQIWALMKKVDEEAYPLSWRLDIAYSPSWPINPEPGPLPKSLDFAEYTLINAPWLPARETNIGYDVDTDVHINGDLSANEIRIGSEPLSGAIVEAVDTAVRESIGTVDGKIDSISGDIAGVAANAQTAATYAQANNNLLTSPNGLSSIHATVKSKASQTSVDAIGTKVDSIKTTVESTNAAVTGENGVSGIYRYIDQILYPLETNINYHVNGLAAGTHPVNMVLADLQTAASNIYAAADTTYSYVSDNGYGLPAIKSAIDAISIPSDYAKQATLVSVSGDLRTDYLSVSGMLGDVAAALDIINGEAV